VTSIRHERFRGKCRHHFSNLADTPCATAARRSIYPRAAGNSLLVKVIDNGGASREHPDANLRQLLHDRRDSGGNRMVLRSSRHARRPRGAVRLVESEQGTPSS